AFYLNLLGHAVGWPSPRGGASGLSDALAAYLRSLGGEIRTGASVARIETAGERVTGARTADEAFTAPVVIATAMPQAMLEMTELNGWYRKALTHFKPGPNTTKLDWALDGPIPWLAEGAREAGTVHVGDRSSGFILVGQQSVADPSRAPAG